MSHIQRTPFPQRIDTVVPMFASRTTPTPLPIRSLSHKQRAAFTSRYTTVTLPEGSHVCRQGVIGHELLFVLSGTGSVIRDSEVIATVEPGDVLGEASMLAIRAPQSADVIATSPMTVAAVSRREFLDAVGVEPSIKQTLAQVAASRQLA